MKFINQNKFTDENLAKLKEWIKDAGGLIDWKTHDSDKLRALLARLEAAERLCNHDTDDCEREFDGCFQCRLTKAWRKSKGE